MHEGLIPARSSEWWRTPVGAAPSHTTSGPRGRDRHVDASLGASATGRWAIGNDRGRTGTGQIPPHRGISRPLARRAAHLGRMELFAAFAEYGAAPSNRMGPHAVRRW